MTRQDNDPATSEWHLDKRIPVALILVLAIQFGGSVYWITTLENRTLTNSDRIKTLESQMDPARLYLERIDQRLQGLDSRLEKIERSIRNMGDPR